MSKFSTFTLSIVGTLAIALLTAQLPLQARSRTPKPCVDRQPITKRVALTLTADKEVITDNIITYQPIEGKASVKPGDIIRYTVVAKNNSHCPLKNLILKQPIPRGTNYLKNSATAVEGAQLLFSIDGGQTFVAEPKIDNRPAPATAYNYLRWKFRRPVPTNAQVKTSYKLQVK
jgi:uncharacterized repeat protein (TIGR01451 family)